MKGWKVYEWTGWGKGPAMTEKETQNAIRYLRKNNYPKPLDCPAEKCPGYRPACKLSICHIAAQLCKDF